MSNKALEHCMGLTFRVEIWPGDESGYIARIPDLPGCMTCADTLDELWDIIEETKELWLETALADGIDIPDPSMPLATIFG